MKYIPIYGHQQPTSQKQRPTIELNGEEIELFMRRHKQVRLGNLKNYQTYDLPMLNIPLPPPEPELATPIPVPFPHSYLNIKVMIKSTYIPKEAKETCSIDDISDLDYLEHHLLTQPWDESTFCQASDYMLLSAYLRQRASMHRNPLDGSDIVRYARNHCIPLRNILQYLLNEELRCMGYSPCTYTSMQTLPKADLDWWLAKREQQEHHYDSEPLFNYEVAMNIQSTYQREWLGI